MTHHELTHIALKWAQIRQIVRQRKRLKSELLADRCFDYAHIVEAEIASLTQDILHLENTLREYKILC